MVQAGGDHEGPDGALYVADFYNRIIRHYEVPLDHPLEGQAEYAGSEDQVSGDEKACMQP